MGQAGVSQYLTFNPRLWAPLIWPLMMRNFSLDGLYQAKPAVALRLTLA